MLTYAPICSWLHMDSMRRASKAKAIPWDKASFLARHALAGPFLDEKRRVEFRSNCMRCLYLALDRLDIQFTAKEISRAMASPTHADETLKALSRYLVGHPRVPWRYPRQEWTGKVWVLTCGEAQFYGAVRCACRTLVLKSLMSDLSLEVKAELVTDSSAWKGLCSRRGAGKNRHIHCPALWLQHAVARRQIAIARRAGKDLAGSRCRDQGGHPRRHHVATAGHVWTGQGRRSIEASVEHGRSASGGLRTWLRYVCTTMSDLQLEVHSSHVLSTKLCSDCVGYPFVIIAVLHQRSACWSSHASLIWVCVFSHFVPVRALMIVPENRVAIVLRD